ncbi:MAG TPA: YfcE family phosphodiesterase [Candidatus Lokiarchaeia archaeon]|nr:YfcE family phosphodiesterase [Candidatus Lokiarchaeia archaeon]
MRVLLIGDFHVPDRASEISIGVDDSIVHESMRRKIDFLACTGDLTKADLVEPILSSWCSEYAVVQGNMDYDLRNAKGFPRKYLFDTGKYLPDSPDIIKLGVTHGHMIEAQGAARGDLTALSDLANEYCVDILISGHTHADSTNLITRKDDGKTILLLNPGSATGVWSFVASMIPSYMMLDINQKQQKLGVTITTHEFLNGKEDKITESFEFHDGTFGK